MRYRAGSVALWLIAALSPDPAWAAGESWSESATRWLSPKYQQLEQRESLLRREIGTLPLPPVSQQSERIGWHSTFASNASSTKWLQVDLGHAQPFDSVTLVPVDVAYAKFPGPGFGFPVRFRVEVSDDASFAAPRLLAAFDDQDFPNPGVAPVFLATPGAEGRYVRLTATRLWPRGDTALLALGEFFVLRGELHIAAGAAVTSSGAYSNAPAWQPSNAADGQSVLGAPVEVTASPGNGWHAMIARTPDTEKWVQIDLGMEIPLDEVRLYPARPKDFPARRGFGFPLRFRVETSTDAAFSNPQILLDHAQADFENPAENPVIIPAAGRAARFVRVTATRLWARTNDFIFALAELEVWSGGTNVARQSEVSSLDTIEGSSWSRRFLIDGFNSQGRIVSMPEWLRGLSRRREVELELGRVTLEKARVADAVTKVMLRWGGATVVIAAGVLLLWMRYRARLRRREVEQLRQRIAGDLHDEIGSNLGSIALLSQMALSERGDSKSDLAEINRVARETADSMRDLVWFIKPAALGSGDFMVKLRETAATMLAGLEWTFEGTSSADEWSLEFKRQVFLIFKEALHNVRRHAVATRVNIRLDDRDGTLEMLISDDGGGFATNGSSEGHGLTSMRHRAEALGGTVMVESALGKGTRVALKVKVTSQWRTATS
jgi:signal transduction histidine kinase